MLRVLYQISKNTFRESLREPVFLLLLVSTLVFIELFPAFTFFVFRDQVKLVTDSSMATSLFFGWIAAVLVASHAVAREIDTGTVILVLSKPVKRSAFIVAKTIGIFMALAIFWFLTSLATMMAVRVAKDQFRIEYFSFAMFYVAILLGLVYGGVRNFMKQSSFSEEAIIGILIFLPLTAFLIYWRPVEGSLLAYDWRMLPALVLLLYAILAMGTIATALSTRLDWVPNLLICAIIFVVGLMSDYLIGRHAENSVVLSLLYAIIPNWQLFWMADALAAKRAIPWAYVGLGGVYISMFVGFFILVANTMFCDREVGEQSLS